MNGRDELSEAGAEAIDLVHLKAQTLDDEALAREVLGLFVAQSRDGLEQLFDPERRSAEVAHKLLGSARSIGAKDVARAAAALETRLMAGAAVDDEIAALATAVAAARAFIVSRLGLSHLGG